MSEYIERDRLLKVLEHNFYGIGGADVMRQLIETQPAADVAPVVHGRWIHYPDCGVTRCSHCGWSIEECWESNYCPNCGARMDGENEMDCGRQGRV